MTAKQQRDEMLRTIRQQAGITQSAAARMLGVPLRTYEGWESGRGGTARRLAAILLVMLTTAPYVKPSVTAQNRSDTPSS